MRGGAPGAARAGLGARYPQHRRARAVAGGRPPEIEQRPSVMCYPARELGFYRPVEYQSRGRCCITRNAPEHTPMQGFLVNDSSSQLPGAIQDEAAAVRKRFPPPHCDRCGVGPYGAYEDFAMVHGDLYLIAMPCGAYSNSIWMCRKCAMDLIVRLANTFTTEDEEGRSKWLG